MKSCETDRRKSVSRAISGPSARERQWVIWISILLLLDGLAVWTSLILAYTLRIASGLLRYNAPYDPGVYRTFALISVPLWLLLFAALGLYQRDHLLGGLVEYQRVLSACTAGVVALIVLSFFSHEFTMISRGWLLLTWALSCILVGLERFLARQLGYWMRRRGWLTSRVLIVGANDQGLAMAKQWLETSTSGMQVVGFLDDFKPIGMPVVNGLKVIGRPTALDEVAQRVSVHEVVIVPTAVAWETFEQVIANVGSAKGYTMRLSPGFYEILATSVAVTNKTFVPLFTVHAARLFGVDAILKTLLDYGLGALLLAPAVPLMGLIGLGLKLVRRDAPALERYLTLGKRASPFTMYKFRSCVARHHSPEATADSAAPSTPPPATWLEQALFRHGLDKLPQLFNVLLGQMSLVGPRPRVLGVKNVTDAEPWEAHNLQTVKPGITGPWAVTGHWRSNDESRNDLYYVRNWTIWLDLQLLFQSGLSLLTGLNPRQRIGVPRGRSSADAEEIR